MIGKEVVCVDDKNIDPAIPNKPKEGKIYTIRKTFKNMNGKWGVYLNEIVNPPLRVNDGFGFHKFEPNFAERRFTTLLGDDLDIEKSLQEQTTDILQNN